MRALFPAFFFGCLFSFGLLLSVCPPCDPDACPPVTCGDPEAIVYDNCDCCPVCGKLEGELCGGDRDVGGMCVSGLYCSYRLGSIFGSQRMGTCEPVICRGQNCGYRQSCRNVTNRITCSCPAYNCSRKNNSVCGNNGKTYPSVCALHAEECSTRNFIGIRQTGKCPQVPRTQRSMMNAVPSCAIPNIMDKVVKVGELLKIDSCHYLACYSQDHLAEVSVPGCIDTPVELDYGVTQPYVDGSWTVWENISICTGPCPNGTMYQRRNCTNPPPSNEGSYCVGPSARNMSCFPKQCQGLCRFRKSLQNVRGENTNSNCITTKQHRVGFECSGMCTVAHCLPMYEVQNFPMSCPNGSRSVPVNVVVHCDCSY